MVESERAVELVAVRGDERVSLPSLPVLRLVMVTPGRIASTQIFDLVFQGLADQGAITYRALYDNETAVEEEMAAVLESDVVFFLRSFTPASLALLRFAQSHGKLAIYSTDDDFLELDPDTPLGRLHHEPKARQAYKALVSEADLVWLYTEEMRRRHAALAKRVVIGRLPSFVEFNGPRRAATRAAAEDAVLVIGYGGSSTHESDLRVVIRPLLAVLDTHPHVRAQFINYAPAQLARHPRVEVRPFVGNLLSYYEFLRQARWTIGLAPLEDTRFNRGKTSNKYREYAGLGVPGIYSRVPVYADCVRHGETGYLADHDEESFAAGLDAMIERPELRAAIRLGGLQDASSTYSLRGMQLHFLREVSRLEISRHREWKRPSLLLVGYARTSSMQIGALQPCRRLAREGLLEFRHVEPDALDESVLGGVDAAIVLRAFEEKTLPLLDWARARSLPVIASWDDDFLEIPPGTPIGDYYHHPSVVRAIERYLREASLVVASTPPLYARSHQYNDRLLEAIYGLDVESLADLERVAATAADGPPAGITRVGFFGSNDAVEQAWMVEALAALRRHYGARIELEAIGIEPEGQLRTALAWWKPGVLPYAESLRLMRTRGWAIGLAPLADSVFNASKQATKLRDYAWAGAAIVCSRVPAYERVLLDGVHGVFAENTAAAWHDAVASLLDDPELAAALRRGARWLLHAVHVQELTDASWIQLLWRIGARREARPQRGHEPTAGLAAAAATESAAAGTARSRRARNSEQAVLELVGREPAQYVPLARPRRYHIVPARQGLRGIELCVGSAPGAGRARLSVALCLPDGEVLREGAIDLSGLRSGTWARLEFPELRNARHRPFVLKLDTEAAPSAEVGVFEASRITSPRLVRLARRLGLAPLVAAPFVRLLYSARPAVAVDELEGGKGAAQPRAEAR